MTTLISILAILCLLMCGLAYYLLWRQVKIAQKQAKDIQVQNAWLQFLAKKYEELWKRYDTKVAWKLDTKKYTISYNIEKNTVECVKLAKGQQGGTNGKG